MNTERPADPQPPQQPRHQWRPHVGYVVSLAVALVGWGLQARMELSAVRAQMDARTPARDRELDSLERRVAAMERMPCR